MIIFILSSFIVLYILLTYKTRKYRKMVEQNEKAFWERERLANSTRKKSLDNLPYISIPLERLPMHVMETDSYVAERLSLIRELAELKIVNFTGYTNTDLKLEYGTANITLLSEYDQSYTLLVRTLQEWAAALFKAGFLYEAQVVLEYAVSIGTDVSRSYYLLADIYDAQGVSEEKSALITAAEQIRSPLRDTIVRTLQESGPYSDLPHSS